MIGRAGREKPGGRFTNEDGNRVLILGAQNAQIGERSLGRLQGVARFHD